MSGVAADEATKLRVDGEVNPETTLVPPPFGTLPEAKAQTTVQRPSEFQSVHAKEESFMVSEKDREDCNERVIGAGGFQPFSLGFQPNCGLLHKNTCTLLLGAYRPLKQALTQEQTAFRSA